MLHTNAQLMSYFFRCFEEDHRVMILTKGKPQAYIYVYQIKVFKMTIYFNFTTDALYKVYETVVALNNIL